MTNSIPSEFYIVDFDRTLVDSDKLLEVFIEVTQEFVTIPRGRIIAAVEDVKRRGDSFDTAGYVRDHLRSEDRGDEWDELEKRFIHECRSLNMLLPGASELLDQLEARGERYGILTYGNPLWQHLKLTAAGFNHVPRIVMEQKEKGKLISSWQQADDTFHLPGEFGSGIASSIILIDDKAISFADFPSAPSRGYWVCDPAAELPSQQGSVPANVVRYDSLVQLTGSL